MDAVVTKARKNRDPYPFTEYSEGIFVGYRGVERFGVKPMFPFGYGMSYGAFEYSKGSVETLPYGYKVKFTVKNTGKAAAAEVPQVYVSKTGGKIARPDRELKGFEKIALAPGESKEVSILLTSGSFARYSTAGHDWVVDKGAYRVLVGSSSADIKLEFPIEL